MPLINIDTLCQQRAAAMLAAIAAARTAEPGSFSSGMLNELYRLCAEDVQ